MLGQWSLLFHPWHWGCTFGRDTSSCEGEPACWAAQYAATLFVSYWPWVVGILEDISIYNTRVSSFVGGDSIGEPKDEEKGVQSFCEIEDIPTEDLLHRL